MKLLRINPNPTLAVTDTRTAAACKALGGSADLLHGVANFPLCAS